MSSVPLSHLLKIGAEALQTTAQTLSGAVNELKTAIATKQDALTFDNAPTENSNNPVKSGGIFTALASKAGTGVVSKLANGLAPQLPDELTTTKFLRQDGTWAEPEQPTVNDATLDIQQNGTSKGTFSANAASNASINIVTDSWHPTAGTVSAAGEVSFTGIDDTNNNAYRCYCSRENVTSEVKTVTGAGTASMSITYTLEDAQAGDTCWLRIIK